MTLRLEPTAADRPDLREHERANAVLAGMLPKDQCDKVFSSHLCDIGPEFLGFVGIYAHLAAIIPVSMTVVGLGCAYAPQCFLFRDHAAYVGVDLLTEVRFRAANTVHFTMPIAEFVTAHLEDFDQASTFAICSYVPPWQNDNMLIARSSFRNVFTYYP